MQTTFKNVTVRQRKKGDFIALAKGDVSTPQSSPAEAVRQLKLGLVNADLDAYIAHFTRYFNSRAQRLTGMAIDLEQQDNVQGLELFAQARVLRSKAATLKRSPRSTFST